MHCSSLVRSTPQTWNRGKLLQRESGVAWYPAALVLLVPKSFTWKPKPLANSLPVPGLAESIHMQLGVNCLPLSFGTRKFEGYHFPPHVLHRRYLHRLPDDQLGLRRQFPVLWRYRPPLVNATYSAGLSLLEFILWTYKADGSVDHVGKS